MTAKRKPSPRRSPPAWIRPQLALLVKEPPAGDAWLHEIKYDGYRLHGRISGGRVQLLTRKGLDWTHKYPAIAAALLALDVEGAHLDGELCAVTRAPCPAAMRRHGHCRSWLR
jgi:bifunctional non-homologous end joining protein LigD